MISYSVVLRTWTAEIMVVRFARILDGTYCLEEWIRNLHPFATAAITTAMVLRAAIHEAHIVFRVAQFRGSFKVEFGGSSCWCGNRHFSVWHRQFQRAAPNYLSCPRFAPVSVAASTWSSTGRPSNQVILLRSAVPSSLRFFVRFSELSETRVRVDEFFKCSVHVPYLPREIVSLDRQLRLGTQANAH
jgi:hypothetical protein